MLLNEVYEDLNVNPITAAASALVNNVLYPEDAIAAITMFISKQGSITADTIMHNDFGTREMRMDDISVTAAGYQPQIVAYLFSRWRYIQQQYAYEDAEYNPTENFSREEHETTEYDIKKRKTIITDDMDARKDTLTDDVAEKEDTYSYAAKVVTSDQDYKQVDVTNQTAPFESSQFYNENKATTGAHKDQIKDTTDARDDSITYGDHIDTHTTESDAYKDTHTTIEDPYKDVHKRDLTMTGAIGTQTASQIMQLDNDFWNHNRWIYEIAHDIANILTKGVYCL